MCFSDKNKLLGRKIIVETNYRANKYFAKKLSDKKNFGQKNYRTDKMIGQQKLSDEKSYRTTKIVGHKKISDEKKFSDKNK